MHNKIVKEDCPCLENPQPDCNIVMSEQPSLKKIGLKLCTTHTEQVSYIEQDEETRI